MSAGGLSLTYNDFLSEVSDYLGYQGDVFENRGCDRLINAGYRKFLTPPPLGGQDAHLWSFLSPEGSIQLIADENVYILPEDFGSLKRGMYYGLRSGLGCLQLTSMSNVAGTAKGLPRYVALRPMDAGIRKQGWEAVFYPVPNKTETVYFAYTAAPRRLSEDYPYPLGGDLHGETILAFILAEAELRKNDERGIHYQNAMERLTASIEVDLRNTPDTVGSMNGEYSVERGNDFLVTIRE